VDPIDGTDESKRMVYFLLFFHPPFLSKPELDDVYAGMVVDLGPRRNLYGNGRARSVPATANGYIPSKTPSLDEAVVGLDLNAYKAKLNMKIATDLIENIKHTRHFGANALEICQVAAGLIDAFIDLRNQNPHNDVAAGFLIVKEQAES